MKIQASTVNLANKYTADKYPASGIFLNKDEHGYEEYVYVNEYSNLVFLLGTKATELAVLGLPEIEGPREETPKVEGSVSEVFALKMLAIATKFGKYEKV